MFFTYLSQDKKKILTKIEIVFIKRIQFCVPLQSVWDFMGALNCSKSNFAMVWQRRRPTNFSGAFFWRASRATRKKFPEEWNVVYLRACASSTFGQFHEICSWFELVWVSSCSSRLAGYLPRPCARTPPPSSGSRRFLHRRSASLLVCVLFAPPNWNWRRRRRRVNNMLILHRAKSSGNTKTNKKQNKKYVDEMMRMWDTLYYRAFFGNLVTFKIQVLDRDKFGYSSSR